MADEADAVLAIEYYDGGVIFTISRGSVVLSSADLSWSEAQWFAESILRNQQKYGGSDG